MNLHPVTRVLLLLVFAGLLPWQSLPGLLMATGLLFIAYVFQPAALQPALKALYRLRWFFLIIAVLYLGFTPGEPLFQGIDWLPTYTGLQLAILRCGVLILMVLAVYLLLQTTSRHELTAALTHLMRWLRPVGIKPDTFARRLTAALDAVSGMQVMVEQARRNRQEKGQDMLGVAAGLINTVETNAQHETDMPALTVLPRVPFWQLLLPTGLLIAGCALLL